SPPPPPSSPPSPYTTLFRSLVHPLLLYTGYVGFVVPFAFAMAALLAGRLDGAWLSLTRRFTVTAWLFLSAGIVYGGWWSYRTLRSEEHTSELQSRFDLVCRL